MTILFTLYVLKGQSVVVFLESMVLLAILPVLAYLFTYFCDFCTQMLHFDGFQCLSLLPESEKLLIVRNGIHLPQQE